MLVSEAELLTFANSHDIISLGLAADEVRRARHGDRTTYVRVADVSSEVGAPAGAPAEAGEVRIAGRPQSSSSAAERVREVRAASPGSPLSAFSLADLEALALDEKRPLRDLLETLAAEGLELVAEAPFDRLRDPRRAIEEVNIAGLRVARLTLQQLPAADAAALYRQVALLQYDVGVLLAFAPLPREFNPAVPTTGYEDVTRIALARLFLPEVPSIQVDWALYGPKLAQVALTVGADDLDGVSPVDDQSEGRRRGSLEEVRRNIRAAGQQPVERDGRFDVRA